MSSRPLPIPVRLKIPKSLGETDLYEVLQKILLNYNRKESLLIKMQDKLTAFRSSESET